MDWRVATLPGKSAFEVIAPKDWNGLTPEGQLAYQSVRLFPTEQEADRFAGSLVDAAKPVRPKLARKLRFQKGYVPAGLPCCDTPDPIAI